MSIERKLSSHISNSSLTAVRAQAGQALWVARESLTPGATAVIRLDPCLHLPQAKHLPGHPCVAG